MRRRSLIAFLCALVSSAIAPSLTVAEDCNENGIPDEVDIAPTFAMSAASSYLSGGSTESKPCAAQDADLDGDGFPDLVILNRGSNSLSLFTHRSAKELRRLAEISLGGEGACWLAAADFDQDGDIDLAVAGGVFPSPGWLRWLENQGRGDLAPSGGLLELSSPTGLAPADFDGDARIDLAVADRAQDGARVAWNRGDFTFEEGPLLPTGRGPVAIAAVDFDGDKLMDLVTANELSSTVSILWSRGSREFDPAASLRVGRVPAQLVHGDLNHDGLEDVVVAEKASKDARVLINEGKREFREGQEIAFDEAPVGLASADVDSDGNVDLVILQNSVGAGHPVATTFEPRSSVFVLYGKGTGSFGGRHEFVVGPPAASLFASDLDADGHADLVSAHESAGTVSVLWGIEGNAFTAGVLSPIFANSRFATGDFNRDGKVDIAFQGEAFLPTTVLWNAGGGDFSRQSTLPYSFTNAVGAGDLDQDGNADLVIADRSAPWEEKYAVIRLLWSSGDERFEVGEAIDGGGNQVSAVDADGDGDLDLALTGGGTDLQILRNQGGRQFEKGVKFTFEDWASEVLFGDIDRDGQLDMVFLGVSIGHVSGAITLYLQGSSGEYRKLTQISGADQPVDAALEDLDGDGTMDLAAVDQGSNELLVWLNHGSEGFKEPGRYAAGSSREWAGNLQFPRSIVAGDLDGDGNADLAVTSPGTSSVLTFINHGEGNFGEAQRFSVDGAPTYMAALDLDGTGKLDLVVQCAVSQDLWVIRNLSSPPRSTDCNANGKPDECDISSGSSLDIDLNGLPDECGARFRRGDSNDDGKADLSDAVHVLGYLFLGVPEALDCLASADTDGDAVLGLSDAIALLDYLFLSGPEPAAPFRTCGLPKIPGGLGCKRQAACP